MPNTVKNISSSAFYNCTSLETVRLSSNLESIGSSAYANCADLRTIYSSAVTPPSISNNTFPNGAYMFGSLYVPINSSTMYQNASGWKEFASIQELDNGGNPIPYYNVDLQIGDGGSVFIDGALTTSKSLSIKEGEDVSMTFTPNDGYELKSLVVNGEDVTSNITNNSYTVTSVSKNTTIVVTFAELPVYLTIKSADNGSIAQEVEKGKTYSFTITPSDGWKIESVSFNGTDVTSQLNKNKYTTPAITAKSELNVVYKQTTPSAVKAVGKANGIRVSASYGTLSIENNGDATNVSVYSTDGSKVASESVGIGTTTIDLPTNNVYIVKVGTETFKVAM